MLRQIARLKPIAETAKQDQEDIGLDNGLGIEVQFASQPGIELAFESLARERSGIDLLNAKHEDGITSATVFVPDGKLDGVREAAQGVPRKKYQAKRETSERTPENTRIWSKPFGKLAPPQLVALWTDSLDSFPITDDEAIWWETWLPVRGNRKMECRSLSLRGGKNWISGRERGVGIS